MVLKARSEPQVPGAVSEAAGADPEQPQRAEAGNVTLTAEQFGSLMARLNAVEGRQTGGQSQAANLPELSSIDASKITQPVLTKSGWLVPEKFGSSPASKAL